MMKIEQRFGGLSSRFFEDSSEKHSAATPGISINSEVLARSLLIKIRTIGQTFSPTRAKGAWKTSKSHFVNETPKIIFLRTRDWSHQSEQRSNITVSTLPPVTIFRSTRSIIPSFDRSSDEMSWTLSVKSGKLWTGVANAHTHPGTWATSLSNCY